MIRVLISFRIELERGRWMFGTTNFGNKFLIHILEFENFRSKFMIFSYFFFSSLRNNFLKKEGHRFLVEPRCAYLHWKGSFWLCNGYFGLNKRSFWLRFLIINDHFDKSKLSFLTVALTFFRITVALIFGMLVPKVTKPYLGSISSSNLYDLRVDNAKQ